VSADEAKPRPVPPVVRAKALAAGAEQWLRDLPGLAAVVTLDLPASNLITRRTLGWEPAQPRLLADLDNGHYFPAS
jgi:hypothetical protein